MADITKVNGVYKPTMFTIRFMVIMVILSDCCSFHGVLSTSLGAPRCTFFSGGQLLKLAESISPDFWLFPFNMTGWWYIHPWWMINHGLSLGLKSDIHEMLMECESDWWLTYPYKYIYIWKSAGIMKIFKYIYIYGNNCKNNPYVPKHQPDEASQSRLNTLW